jgi:hypothetical protein
VWAPQGKNLEVHFDLDTIDRLGAEILRGFGAVPKRGAEVGGVLLGSIVPGSPTVVRVADFEPVPCAYRRGPSYLLDSEENAAFIGACERLQHANGHSAVGYYRGNTREGFSLGEEDLDLLNHCFPAPASIALLVRPNAMKASIGAVFFREGGRFPETTPEEFPFRRWELTGEEAPPRPAKREPGPELVRSNPKAVSAETPSQFATTIEYPPPESAPPTPLRQVRRTWLPMSFLFMIFGLGLGFLVAVLAWPRISSSPAPASDYGLGLSASRTGDNLMIRWNPAAPAIRSARSAVLEIEDGTFSPKPQELDTAHLDNGSLIYRNSTKTVRLKLRVNQSTRTAVEETAEWKE